MHPESWSVISFNDNYSNCNLYIRLDKDHMVQLVHPVLMELLEPLVSRAALVMLDHEVLKVYLD